MKDLGQEIARAAAHVEVRWDAARQAAAERGLLARRRRRAQTRGTAAAVIVVLAAVGGSWLLVRRAPAPVAATRPAPPPAGGDEARRLRLGDRAVVDLDAGGEAHVGESAGGRAIVVSRGRARVVIEPAAAPVRVVIGGVTVEARAARFAVARLEAGARIQVDLGEVTVLSPGAPHVIAAGGDERVSPPAAAPTPTPPAAIPEKHAPRLADAAPTWIEVANAGDYDRAYALLTEDHGRRPRDATGLLLMADVARLSHHPTEAVGPLHEVLEEHGDDRRAPLAAFTLGRVRLDELGQPTEAAQAFALAAALAPSGPLAEDAEAREVEALSRAGDLGGARQRAEDYVRRHPDGRRLRAVRRFGGLD